MSNAQGYYEERLLQSGLMADDFDLETPFLSLFEKRFPNNSTTLYRAFQRLDLDRSGCISLAEYLASASAAAAGASSSNESLDFVNLSDREHQSESRVHSERFHKDDKNSKETDSQENVGTPRQIFSDKIGLPGAASRLSKDISMPHSLQGDGATITRALLNYYDDGDGE
ncbi:hypothetical protein CYMTET_12929 [Cymbomonas tetramitiformis]|uniref:EF-hand domain-containing protein n=1 Tax=Cymbomonas tetramitiformis TaxID=36881 RepID=A0AAE0LBQ1_9CHLO|nr:hypothetical protein CYMTET_12929 [Cymbomonas tetramitiformis]